MLCTSFRIQKPCTPFSENCLCSSTISQPCTVCLKNVASVHSSTMHLACCCKCSRLGNVPKKFVPKIHIVSPFEVISFIDTTKLLDLLLSHPLSIPESSSISWQMRTRNCLTQWWLQYSSQYSSTWISSFPK